MLLVSSVTGVEISRGCAAAARTHHAWLEYQPHSHAKSTTYGTMCHISRTVIDKFCTYFEFICTGVMLYDGDFFH